MKINDTTIRELKNKCVQLVKVLWSHHGVEDETWELKADIGKAYLNYCNFNDKMSSKGGRM